MILWLAFFGGYLLAAAHRARPDIHGLAAMNSGEGRQPTRVP
jgi:hypothetical protein